MITVRNFGKHENVVIAEFGYGDIKITKARDSEDAYESMLLFYNQSPHPIGEEDNEFKGKTTDELAPPSLVMHFSNPESIGAVIHSLIELQKELFSKNCL